AAPGAVDVPLHVADKREGALPTRMIRSLFGGSFDHLVGRYSPNETLWKVFPIFGRDFIPAASCWRPGSPCPISRFRRRSTFQSVAARRSSLWVINSRTTC